MSPSDLLKKPIQYITGVGPRRAEAFQRLDVETVADLLNHFPRAWQDRREPTDLSAPANGSVVVACGKVLRAESLRAGPRMVLFKAVLDARGAPVTALWFKHASRTYDVFASLKRDIVPGRELWVIGSTQPSLLGAQEIHVEEHFLADAPRAGVHVRRLVPLYGLSAGLTQRLVREAVFSVVEEAFPLLREDLPPALLRSRRLLEHPQALRAIHFPSSPEELASARGRLAYEELLVMELAWVLKRRQIKNIAKGYGYEIKKNLLAPFRQNLGFQFTGAQTRVIHEIFKDMRHTSPMTRLLQGDVGSGKTVVALSALLLAVENGFQGAFLAPTEILADQHLATLRHFLRGLPVNIALLSSRVKAKERSAILSRLYRGEIDIVVGTHALLESAVQFPRLRLAVIDEQHRFGVRQRATLRQKSRIMDLLIMTATPIPRTLALALYGDLDVSTLDELPPGKTTAKTFHAPQAEALDAVKREVAAGRQAYIVYPLIEESSLLDLRSAKKEFERLRAGPLAGLDVSLIHGAMPGNQKTRIMNAFAAGQSQVLVATPVIEVGIDVPNATVMVIQNADRFGLASLHQLRGRIGRGRLASSCFLVAAPKTPQALRRIATLVGSSDGFRIGEEDLKLRGPGEFLGTAQHGELSLAIADLVKDAPLLAAARQDAQKLLDEDARLLKPENAGLRDKLISLYQKKWGCVDLA